MRTQIKRRYSSLAPEFKTYSDYFDKYLIESTILNDRNQRINIHTQFADLNGMKSTLYQLQGDEKGRYTNSWGEEVYSFIRSAENQLSEIKIRFESYVNNRVAQGHAKPTQWPPELLKERLRLEAHIDVMNREAEWLRYAINNYKEKEAVKRSSKVLEYGPRGNGTLRNGQLCEIDGQLTAFKDDVLIISDPASPYNGMAVSDYRDHVVKPWTADRRKAMIEKEQQRAQDLLKKGKSDIEVHLSRRKIHPSSLPPWPECVPNLLVSTEDVVADE
jgi:hypothetical protein